MTPSDVFMQDGWGNVEDASRYMRISIVTVHREIRRGTLAGVSHRRAEVDPPTASRLRRLHADRAHHREVSAANRASFAGGWEVDARSSRASSVPTRAHSARTTYSSDRLGAINGELDPASVYVTLNPVSGALLDRSRVLEADRATSACGDLHEPDRLHIPLHALATACAPSGLRDATLHVVIEHVATVS
jgi:hypothetical protein